MKILFICIYSHPSICGVWNRVYNLSKLLIKKGHEVYVFSTNTIKGTSETSLGYENYQGIQIYRFKPFFSSGENVKFWNFYNKLKKINPDLIIAEVYRHPHTSRALKAARKLNKPVFLTTHAPFVSHELRSSFGNFIANFYDKFIGKRKLNNFDKIIVITKWEIPYLSKIGIDNNKIVYIPNGIPTEFFKLKRKKGKGILFFGRIAPIKNLESLVKALSCVVKEYPNTQLKIVGPSEELYKKRLLELVKSLNLEKNITFLPAIYDLREKIKLIDESEIFVLPSKREAMPQSLIEAMARGKIVIASKNDGTNEIINNTNGFLFPTSDSDKLAEIIKFCLNKKNEKELDKLRKNAIYKSEDFNWEKVFKTFEKLINNYKK